MFKKKKADQQDKGGSKKAASKQIGNKSGLQTHLVHLAIAILAITALTASVFYFVQGGLVDQMRQQEARSVAQVLAARLSNTARVYREVVSNAVDDEQLALLVSEERTEELQAYKAGLARMLPTGVGVQFFPYGWDQTDRGRNPPVTFATLDMLRTVESSGKASKMEVHQIASEQKHLAFAVPVSRLGRVAGSALITLPFSQLNAIFNGVDTHLGLQLSQVAAERSVPIVSMGNFKASGSNVGAVPVSDTIWRVDYVSGSAAQLEDMIMGLVIIVVSGLLMLLAVIALNRQLKRHFNEDQVHLYKMAEGITRGRSVAAAEAYTQEMQGAFNLVTQLSQVIGGRLKDDKRPAGAIAEPEMQPSASGGIDVDEIEEVISDPSDVGAAAAAGISSDIFRAYDIRGVVDETLTDEVFYELGRAIGSEVYEAGQQTVIVGRDCRNSSEGFSKALTEGLMASGRDVVDIGEVPTPLLYFATHFLGTNSGVMVTGSHNPANHNGMKIVIGGEALHGGGIAAIEDRINSGNLFQGEGHRTEQNLIHDYIKRVSDDVQLGRPLKVVVDSGNGVAGIVAPQMLRELGCDVIELFSELDGNFPHHHPDPGQPENLADMIALVKHQGADIGLAFDGDGDRLGVVDSNGRIIWPDRALMLLARDVLMRHPGADILYDVKSTRHLASEILSFGGRPIMWKSGHSLMKAKMRETGALLAGELSGHIFFKERWYGFDDAMYAAARLLEVLSVEVVQSAEVFSELPDSITTPELVVPVPEAEQIVQNFVAQAAFSDAKMIDIDGLRAEFKDGWGLLRASNTLPALVFRFEAESKESLTRIQTLFKDLLQQIAPQVSVPF